MIYIVSFIMIASNQAGAILKDIKNMFNGGGDIKIIHDFISSIADKIKIKIIESKHILIAMRKNCSNIIDKNWFKIIYRVMLRVKNLLKTCQTTVISTNWQDVISTLKRTYRNKIFFNQSLYGGPKTTF